MRRRIGLILFTLALSLPTPARAGLIITASGGSVAPGGHTLTVPVYFTTDGTDNLGQFTVVFNITANPSNAIAPAASLEFVAPTSSATDPTLNDMQYVYNPANPNLTGSASFKQDTGETFGTTRLGERICG